jgi:hypothetical protein
VGPFNADGLLRPAVDRRLRRLPRPVARGLGLAWRAAPRSLSVGLQLVAGLGVLLVAYIPSWLAANRGSRLLHVFAMVQTEPDRRRVAATGGLLSSSKPTAGRWPPRSRT